MAKKSVTSTMISTELLKLELFIYVIDQILKLIQDSGNIKELKSTDILLTNDGYKVVTKWEDR